MTQVPSVKPNSTACTKNGVMRSMVRIDVRDRLSNARHRGIRQPLISRVHQLCRCRPPLIPPQAHRLILSSAPHHLAVGTPVDGVHLVLVTRQIVRQLSGPHVPALERRVLGRRHEQPGVGREGALVDGRDVAAQRVDELSVPRWHARFSKIAAARADSFGVKKEIDTTYRAFHSFV